MRHARFFRRPAAPEDVKSDNELLLFASAEDKKLRTVDYDNEVRELAYVGEGEGTGDIDVDNTLPWLIDVLAYMSPHAQTDWDTIAVAQAYQFNSYRWNVGVQNAELSYNLVLGAGTWTFEIAAVNDPSYGIMTLSIDGDNVGTIDFYAGGNTWQLFTITDIDVATSGKKLVKMKMATKNPSASAYSCAFSAFRLLRTA